MQLSFPNCGFHLLIVTCPGLLGLHTSVGEADGKWVALFAYLPLSTFAGQWQVCKWLLRGKHMYGQEEGEYGRKAESRLQAGQPFPGDWVASCIILLLVSACAIVYS